MGMVDLKAMNQLKKFTRKLRKQTEIHFFRLRSCRHILYQLAILFQSYFSFTVIKGTDLEWLQTVIGGAPKENLSEGATAHFRKELSCNSVGSGVSVKLK